jgi:hypothetical protein
MHFVWKVYGGRCQETSFPAFFLIFVHVWVVVVTHEVTAGDC